MIAVIVTSHDMNLEKKLAAFDSQHDITPCTAENGCLVIATPFGTADTNASSGYNLSPFVEQAHQSAPGAEILVVEAKSTSWYDKNEAVNYIKTLPDVSKVSSISYSKIVVVLGLVLK